MTRQKTKLDSRTAHRQAGICAAFMWQDEAAEGHLDAKAVEVDYTTVLGTLPEKAHDAPVYLVHVQGTAVSTFGYSYPIERTLKVYLQQSSEDEDGEPMVAEATEEEEKACEQHGRDLACKEYGELSHIVQIGAYSEGDNGIDVSARLLELECAALDEGLNFVPVQGEGKTVYKLEPATAERLAAYKKAKEEAEAAEGGEEEE